MTATFAYFTFSIGFLSGIVVMLLGAVLVFGKLWKTKPAEGAQGPASTSDDIGNRAGETSKLVAPPSTEKTDDDANKSGGE